MPARLKFALTVMLGAGACVPAGAVPVLWQISNVTFSDGGTASGTFLFDAATGAYSRISITTTAGTALAGTSYANIGIALVYGGLPSIVLSPNPAPLTGQAELGFSWATALTGAGGVVAIAPYTVSNLSYEGVWLSENNIAGKRYIAAGGKAQSAAAWSASGSGSWDSSANWLSSFGPSSTSLAVIDTASSLTVTGPASAATVSGLNIGGYSNSINSGIATLSLNGGTLNVRGDTGQFTTVAARGVLTGDGTLTGAVNNLGTVKVSNLTLSGGLSNRASVVGNGALDTNLVNATGGTLRVDAGQQIRLSGTAHSNSGTFDLNGGELQVAGTLTNNADGRILMKGARLGLGSGLANNGQVQVSFGTSEVFGAVTTNSGGKLILSGNSNTTFWDAIEVKSGGELRVSQGSAAVFFGAVTQRTGATFSGAGSKFYEGGLTVGGSPGLGLDGGDVAFGNGNVYVAEIGGVDACTAACEIDTALRDSSFDHYSVAGRLNLGGTLKLVSWNGFVAQAGQHFDLLDWGSTSGQFDAIDSTGLALAAGTVLDTSRLGIDGTVAVLAVPEPVTAALYGAGLAALGWRLRRLKANCCLSRRQMKTTA